MNDLTLLKRHSQSGWIQRRKELFRLHPDITAYFRFLPVNSRATQVSFAEREATDTTSNRCESRTWLPLGHVALCHLENPGFPSVQSYEKYINKRSQGLGACCMDVKMQQLGKHEW